MIVVIFLVIFFWGKGWKKGKREGERGDTGETGGFRSKESPARGGLLRRRLVQEVRAEPGDGGTTVAYVNTGHSRNDDDLRAAIRLSLEGARPVGEEGVRGEPGSTDTRKEEARPASRKPEAETTR